MQSVKSRIWTRVAVSISCDDNHYTTGTSNIFLYIDSPALITLVVYINITYSLWIVPFTIIKRLYFMLWKWNLTDKMKRSFLLAAVMSILLYGCTPWTLTKRLEKKLDGNYTRMLRAILNKSWQQHPRKHQLYSHLPPITKTTQVRWTRHTGHCWRSRDELISDVLLWTLTYRRAKAGRPARTYIQQLCEDTGCSPEDLLGAMNDREKWSERVRDIRANGMMMMMMMILCYVIYIYIYIVSCNKNTIIYETLWQILPDNCIFSRTSNW